MITLSPQIQFQTACKPDADEHAKQVRERWMSTSMTHAFASMSYGSATREEINGARKFIDIFLNLSEPVQQPKQAPSKDLKEP